MNGYSRYAATALWVGNADNWLVKDGLAANYAAASTTVRLFKNWMGQYHKDLKDRGIFITPPGFDEVKPENVKLGKFQSATTERGRGGGCRQMVDTWMRTDIEYKGDCQGGNTVPLPEFKKDLARSLACSRGIPVQGCERFDPSPSPTPSTTPGNTNTTPSPTVPPAQTPKPQPTPVPTRE